MIQNEVQSLAPLFAAITIKMVEAYEADRANNWIVDDTRVEEARLDHADWYDEPIDTRSPEQKAEDERKWKEEMEKYYIDIDCDNLAF